LVLKKMTLLFGFSYYLYVELNIFQLDAPLFFPPVCGMLFLYQFPHKKV
jgi:hypothetical protein